MAETFRKKNILDFLKKLSDRKDLLQKQLDELDDEESRDLTMYIKGQIQALEMTSENLKDTFDVVTTDDHRWMHKENMDEDEMNHIASEIEKFADIFSLSQIDYQIREQESIMERNQEKITDAQRSYLKGLKRAKNRLASSD